MGEVIRGIPRSHIMIVSLLPLVLNIFLTPYMIISLLSLDEFLRDPVYYIYNYGPVLWSAYHVLLTMLVWYFVKREGGAFKEIIGSVRGASTSSMVIVISLTAFSMIWFQVVEAAVTNLFLGAGYMEQIITSFKKMSFSIFLYSVIITSLTAGVCEEIIWRGYLQTRLQRTLGGRLYRAIAIQALLFGLWHGLSIHAIFTAVFGYLYGFIYARTKRLTPIIVSHWLGDILGFNIMYYIM